MELIWVTPGYLGSPVTSQISGHQHHTQHFTNKLIFGGSMSVQQNAHNYPSMFQHLRRKSCCFGLFPMIPGSSNEPTLQ